MALGNIMMLLDLTYLLTGIVVFGCSVYVIFKFLRGCVALHTMAQEYEDDHRYEMADRTRGAGGDHASGLRSQTPVG